MMYIPVMEIGGTHVGAALFDPISISAGTGNSVDPLPSRYRESLDSSATAEEIVTVLLRCASRLDPPSGVTWGVAVPGPFDYDDGIGRFHDVGKFDELDGFDLGRALLLGLPGPPSAVRFLNDADAFGLGEWAAGTMEGHSRGLALTLGTGIGSAFLADGEVVDSGPSVPPQGNVHLLSIDGLPLEDTVSRRAILARYGQPSMDVVDIAAAARSGEVAAGEALWSAFYALGSALRPWACSFGATIVVVGGSMTGSWDLVAPPLTAALDGPRVVRAGHEQEAALIGAGLSASRVTP